MDNKADIRRAAYQTVHEFPKRGDLNEVKSAALVLGLAAGTVYNKAAEENDSNDFTLGEAAQLMLASKDYRILHALAAACDHVAISLADFSHISDVALLDLILQAQKAAGAKAEIIRRALEDGRIDPEELREICRANHEHVRAELEVISRLEAIAQASARK